jgi:hypothetical protein
MTDIRIGAVVGVGGRVELTLPLPAGTTVEVLVRDANASDGDEAIDDVVEWDNNLQERLDALDRGEVDPRPWKEALEEIRSRLVGRATNP